MDNTISPIELAVAKIQAQRDQHDHRARPRNQSWQAIEREDNHRRSIEKLMMPG